MTATDIERLGVRVMLAYGMPTHVTVLPLAWSPAIDRMRAHDQEARRIARMWREEFVQAIWNVPTQEVECAE